MHTTNYIQTLILPSPDSAANSATAPGKPGTVAAMQYERLQGSPHELTSDDLIFGVYADRKGIDDAERQAERTAFFSKGQPCLRSSPLVKTYGWAVHNDEAGRVALVDPQSETFRQLVDDPSVTKVAGMRSSRS